jgi:hypothetical protein
MFSVPIVGEKTVSYVNKPFPGIGFPKNRSLKPIDMYYSGHLFIKYVYPNHRFVAIDSNYRPTSLECKRIIAENALTLYQNDLPDLYIPTTFGDYTEGDHKYYFMEWDGYTEDYWNNRIGMEFNFTEPIFKTVYNLKRIQDSWSGKNICYSRPWEWYDFLVVSEHIYAIFARDCISNSMRLHAKDQGCFVLMMTIENYALNRLVLKDFWGYPNDSMSGFASWFFKQCIFSNGNITTNSDYIGEKLDYWKDGLVTFWCMLEDVKYDEGTTDANEEVTITNPITHISESVTLYSDYDSDYGKYFRVNTNHNKKSGSGIKMLGCLNQLSKTSDLNKLRVVMRDDFRFVQLPGVEYDPSENPFHFVFKHGDYTITPMPESCSTLFTKYNIKTDGIIIAENIESHEYKINGIGANLEFIIVRVNNLDREVSRLIEIVNQLVVEVEATQSFINFWSVTSMIMSLSEPFISLAFSGGIGALEAASSVAMRTRNGYARIGEEGDISLGAIAEGEESEIVNISGNVDAARMQSGRQLNINTLHNGIVLDENGFELDDVEFE